MTRPAEASLQGHNTEASRAPPLLDVIRFHQRQHKPDHSRVFVREAQPPRDEACPERGRRVPTRLIRIYHLVDLDHS